MSYSFQIIFISYPENKRDLIHSGDKSPYINRKKRLKKNKQHHNATKHFDYTTIADRLGTFVASNNSQPIDVFIPVHEYPTFPLTETAV